MADWIEVDHDGSPGFERHLDDRIAIVTLGGISPARPWATRVVDSARHRVPGMGTAFSPTPEDAMSMGNALVRCGRSA